MTLLVSYVCLFWQKSAVEIEKLKRNLQAYQLSNSV